LEKWRLKYGDRLCDAKVRLSNAVGTEFHRCCEVLLSGKSPETPCKRVSAMVDVFKRGWFDTAYVAPWQTEMKVWSVRYRYQGTLDMVGEVNGVPTLVDFKTSSRINEDMGMQLAAYANAYRELTGQKVDNGLIVCVSKEKPDHILTTRMFDLKSKKYLKRFLQLREEFIELPCPYIRS
jgi:hypothetical protein